MAKELNSQRFSGLELLPTSLLEEIIQADFYDDAEYDNDLIEYVLELIASRKLKENLEKSPSVQASWEKLQLRLDSAQEFGISQQDHKRTKRTGKKAFRYAAIVAACIASVFAVMITVQALGVDVFGLLGSWTDSSFRFSGEVDATTVSAPHYQTPANDITEALSELGMPTVLAPTWVPEDYGLVSVDPFTIDGMKGVYVVYSNPNEDHFLTIDICEYSTETLLYNTYYEKDDQDPELYTYNGRTFYIFTNAGTWTAAWCDGKFDITIAGVPSKEIIISIINSIEE